MLALSAYIRRCQFTQPLSNFGIGWAQRLYLTTPVAADAAQPLTEFGSGPRIRCRLLTG